MGKIFTYHINLVIARFQGPINSMSLSQWLNFKLSGITCLVGKIKFKLFISGSIGWVRYVHILGCCCFFQTSASVHGARDDCFWRFFWGEFLNVLPCSTIFAWWNLNPDIIYLRIYDDICIYIYIKYGSWGGGYHIFIYYLQYMCWEFTNRTIQTLI